jgi:hypothetical protein
MVILAQMMFGDPKPAGLRSIGISRADDEGKGWLVVAAPQRRQKIRDIDCRPRKSGLGRLRQMHRFVGTLPGSSRAEGRCQRQSDLKRGVKLTVCFNRQWWHRRHCAERGSAASRHSSKSSPLADRQEPLEALIDLRPSPME